MELDGSKPRVSLRQMVETRRLKLSLDRVYRIGQEKNVFVHKFICLVHWRKE